jgi:cytochrome c-type biogenesis protein
MVALFAPCCITVLLPAYLASVFREKRNILKMTLVFFGGIAVVLIPIGLGAAGVARLLRSFHQELYIFGGLLMIVLAALAVFGKGLAMIPMPKRPMLSPYAAHPKSVFLLGVFSGAATSCCAPVLAGAVTLAVISGAFWKALIVVFAYIFGMTFPLFVAAYLYDRFRIEESRIIQGRIFRIVFGSRTLLVHSTNVVAGAVFLVVGAVLLFLAFSGNVFWAPALQVKIGNTLNIWSQQAFRIVARVPDIVWGIGIIGFFLFLLSRVLRVRKRNNKNA